MALMDVWDRSDDAFNRGGSGSKVSYIQEKA